MTTKIPAFVLERHLNGLLADFRDLAPSHVDTYDVPPTSLDALRMIHKSHPAIIRGCRPLTTKGKEREWSKPETYKELLGDSQITIAVTDDGMADSVRVLNDGSTSFVKPLEEDMSIQTFLDKLTDTDVTEIVYLQSQDGNIYRSTASSSSESNDPIKPQLAALQPYIQRDLSWMLEAVGSTAEAVNLWIGSSRSTTSLHHDPYENIYHVLSGSKTFTLVSPIEGFWLDQQFHQPSTLRKEQFHQPSTLQRTTDNNDLKPILDPPPAHEIPWVQSTQFPATVSPLIVTINEGETLFLPSGWWHRVDQHEGSEGLAVAVNYWYTAEIYPDRYAFERFTRRIAREAGRYGVIPNPEDLDEDESGNDAENLDDSDGVWDSGVSGEEWDPEDWGR